MSDEAKRRDVSKTVRLTKLEAKLLAEAARQAGIDTSEYVRSHALAAAAMDVDQRPGANAEALAYMIGAVDFPADASHADADYRRLLDAHASREPRRAAAR